MSPSSIFSYAETLPSSTGRKVARVVEAASGRRKLERLYAQYQASGSTDFFDAALKLLDVRVAYDTAAFDSLPPDVPVVFVANHPFGVLDGLILGWLAGQVRKDVKIIAHSALARVPETVPYLFPVDFSGTRAAERENIKVRMSAARYLADGGALVVFPAGMVSTAPRPFARRAEEGPWGPLTARLIKESGAYVVPVFFPGQNSRLFHVVSHMSQSVRQALLFRESLRLTGTDIEVRIGEPVSPETSAAMRDRAALMAFLRDRTLSLADHPVPPAAMHPVTPPPSAMAK